MDRRLDERWKLRVVACVTDLRTEGEVARGEITDVSDGGICVQSTAALILGSVVRVDFAAGSLFGQVMHVTAEGGGFLAGIEVFRVLLGESDLARLLEHALGQVSGRAPETLGTDPLASGCLVHKPL